MIDLPAPTDPEDALSQPTRARLFALLSELGRPAGTAELAEALELHPNGIRIHLERLQQAGLIERARVRQARGRPPDAWAIAPDAQPAGQPPRAYHDLGRWLARSITTRPAALLGVERTGREIGRELAPQAPGHPADALKTSLASLGFQPAITTQRDGQLTICLRNCPYRGAVHENQPAICALHKGITRGLLDVLAPRAKLTAFIPHDPDQAGCEIKLRGLPEPTTSQ